MATKRVIIKEQEGEYRGQTLHTVYQESVNYPGFSENSYTYIQFKNHTRHTLFL